MSAHSISHFNRPCDVNMFRYLDKINTDVLIDLLPTEWAGRLSSHLISGVNFIYFFIFQVTHTGCTAD